jgi:hypothetical protein
VPTTSCLSGWPTCRRTRAPYPLITWTSGPFANGTTATADIVIGAGGANSKICVLVTPSRPFYAGLMVVEGAVANAAQHAARVSHLL